MIESYAFGKMVVDGCIHTSDLIIFPDHMQSTWWRKSGHRLCLEDIEDVFIEKPEYLVIGTGYLGLMKVDKEVQDKARKTGITLIIEKTPQAFQTFNTLSSKKKSIGAFHLTC